MGIYGKLYGTLLWSFQNKRAHGGDWLRTEYLVYGGELPNTWLQPRQPVLSTLVLPAVCCRGRHESRRRM